MLINYSHWDVYEGASEGSGRSDKIWLINSDTKEIGLFKFTKTNKTTEHISEKLAFELARLIDLKCARIELGKYKSRIGSMSYLINNDTEILIEGIYLINKKYPSYNPFYMYDDISKEYYSLEMILNSLEEYNLEMEFLKVIIFDFLIGNTDRHQNNWAVLKLKNSNKYKMCPIYDNGSSLCCYIPEEQIDSYLGNDKMKFNSLIISKSKSRIRIDKKKKKEPTHLEMLQYIKSHYNYNVDDFVKTIIQRINSSSLDEILNNYSDDLLSSKRKMLIKKFLLEKIHLMSKIFERKEE